MFLVPSCSCLCHVNWSQVLSLELQLHLNDQQLYCLLRCHLYNSYDGMCISNGQLYDILHSDYFFWSVRYSDVTWASWHPKSSLVHSTKFQSSTILPFFEGKPPIISWLLQSEVWCGESAPTSWHQHICVVYIYFTFNAIRSCSKLCPTKIVPSEKRPSRWSCTSLSDVVTSFRALSVNPLNRVL